MNLPNNNLNQDENFSSLWNVPDVLDGTLQFSTGLIGALRDPTLEDIALASFFTSDDNPPPWVPDDQRLNSTSTLAAIENEHHDGRRISGLSSSTDSSLSASSIERAGSRLVDLPLENVDVCGTQWENIEDMKLEKDSGDVLRRRSLDSLRSGAASIVDREAAMNNRSKSATHADFVKPRRRRGRKPSNLSPEEKRRRRLERGRLAANKCRRKKRELENSLEERAKELISERNSMVRENEELQLEMQQLVEEIASHSSPACIGFPEPAQLLAYMQRTSSAAAYQTLVDFEQTLEELQEQQPALANRPSLSENMTSYSFETSCNDNPVNTGEIMELMMGNRK